jgi:AraC family transcriptional regulator, transcriptional activator of pobA
MTLKLFFNFKRLIHQVDTMKQKTIPIYTLGQHCPEVQIDSIKVSSFHEEMCTAAEFMEHHRHEYYEVVWLKKGKGLHHIDTISYPYNGSVLFMLSPGQIHKLEQDKKGEGYVIKFLPSIFRDARDVEEFILNTGLFDNVQANPIVKVPVAQHAMLEDVILKMEVEFNSGETDKNTVLSAYLKIFMTILNRIKRTQHVTDHAIDFHLAIFSQYKAAIEKNFRTEHSVEVYANLLNTQPRTLNTLSKKFAGKSAGQLISDRIILEAKRCLHFEQGSIKEIAHLLGFEDPAYFTRFFKKHTGISPLNFKSVPRSAIKRTA